MKKILPCILFLICSLTSSGQITIDNSDMPSVNDTVRFSTSTSTVSSGLLNQTGANQTWDFSFLAPNAQDIASHKSAASINLAYILSFSSSSFGRKDADMNIGIIQATDVYNFYKNSSANFAMDGRGLTVNSIPAAQTYSSKDYPYRFPLTYGNTDSCQYAGGSVNLVVASIATSGKRVNTVDGWGSITTPYGTFNCIRIKSVVRHTDTLKTQIVNIPVTRNYTEYKWLAKGQKIPVLEITVVSGIGGSTTIRYRDIYRASVFEGKARFNASKTKATVKDTINLNDLSAIIPAAPVSWQWTITPNTFQFTGGTNASSQNPKVLFNDTGYYTIKLKTTYTAGSDDTTRSNYIQIGLAPAPDFIADKLISTPLTTIAFTDSSKNDPVSWQWMFSPNTVSYVGGTSQTSKNPKIVCNDTGYYSVRLIATNAFGKDTLIKLNYLRILDQLGNPPVAGFYADQITPTTSQVVNFTDSSSENPTSWLWTFSPNTINHVGTTDASQNPKVVFSNTGFYTVTLRATNLFGFDEEVKIQYIRVIGAGVPFVTTSPVFSLFPNPANRSLCIIQQDKNAPDVTICDLNGRILLNPSFTSPTLQVDVSELAPGLYLVKASGQTQKLIITH